MRRQGKAWRRHAVALVLLTAGGASAGRAGVCQIPGGAAAISGRVTAAATGIGLAGATVVAERMIDGTLTLIGSALSGPGGDYQIAGLFPGDYFVRTSFTPELVDQVWEGVECETFCEPQNAGTAIPVATGSSVEGIDFALAAGGRLEGFVRLADGTTPVPGATVEVYFLGAIGTANLGNAVAGADGAWHFDGLASGNYKVRAYAPALLAEVFPNALCPSPCDVFSPGNPIAVTTGATTSGIDLALAEGATISGVITDLGSAPLAGVAVALTNAASSRFANGVSNASGAWITGEGLEPGTYFARTSSDHLDELWDNLVCEPFCFPTAGTPITVTTGGTPGIDFALALRGAISGTILENGTGVPIAGVTVGARDEIGSFVGFASTATDGTYRIGGLAPGPYFLTATDGFHVGEFYDDAGTCYDPFTCFPSQTPTEVAVVGSAETDGIDFGLDRGGVLQGVVVVAATHVPVQGAIVNLFRLDGNFETSAFTGLDGRFRMSGLPAGVSYRISALPPGGTELLGEVWEEQPCDPASCPPDAGAPVAVVLDAPACVAFTLDGLPKGTGIAGAVTHDSQPLGGATVKIFDAAGAQMGSVLTDAGGAYLTVGALVLPPGTYYVTAGGIDGFSGELYDNIPCDACDPTTGTPVSVVAETTTGGVDFDLPGLPPVSRIFLENCQPDGCTYFRSSFEDSRINRSTIPSQSVVQLPPFGYTPLFWDQVVACVQRAYAPFQVEVTDIDPGSAPHLEHVVAGLPSAVGMDPGVAGVSPFACAFLPNSISFTFSAVFGDTPSEAALNDICWTIVHEVGHQHGLDHHFYAPDAMTYLEGCGAKGLPDRAVPCGRTVLEPCQCGGSSENSYARVRAVLGASDLLFRDGFEVVEPGLNCAWSDQIPPPGLFGPAEGPISRPAASCGTFLPANSGLRMPPGVAP
jgi:hypothetical protein